MKKIGVLTFHRADSYGAHLQAYATVAFLNQAGYEAELVDYTNPYEQRFRKFFYSENGRMTGFLTSFVKDVVFKKRYYKSKAFGNIEQYCQVSKNKYKTKEALDNASYDVLVVGSDQVWNREITNGLDDTFLLMHGQASKRISISSSMGSVTLTDEEKRMFQKAFEQFDAISVREEFAKMQLQETTDNQIKVLMDPTFLIDKEKWMQNLVQKSTQYRKIKEKYILTFFLTPDETYKSRMTKLANKLKLPVWSIQSIAVKRIESDKIILGATVADFLALIANAEVVVTDSFHGTALSINMEKNFVSFKNKGNPVRVMTLLDALGLSNRLDMNEEDYRPVNYADVNRVLEPLRKDSKKWIVQAIEGEIYG